MAEENKVRRTAGRPKAESQSMENSVKKEKLGKHAANELVLADELLRLMRAL